MLNFNTANLIIKTFSLTQDFSRRDLHPILPRNRFIGLCLINCMNKEPFIQAPAFAECQWNLFFSWLFTY